MSVFRFFDSDEMSHMHWAWLVSQGEIPFRDFFYYNLPGYQYLIVWPFFLPASSATLILVRLWQLVLYLLTSLLIHRFTFKLTGSSVASLLSVAIFLVFPMTLDKTIDIRPDISMMLLYLIAVEMILSNRTWKLWKLFTVGICGAASVFITLKTIVFALPALMYIYFSHKPRPTPNQWLITGLGLVVPALIYFLYLVASDALIPAIPMVTRDSFAVNAGKIPFSPWKALSPWPLVYLDQGGDSLPWRVNSVIWISAVIGLIHGTIKDFKKSLFLLIFFVFGVAFLFLFPAPYVQYFLPLSVFAAPLAAHGFLQFLSTVSKIFKVNLAITSVIGISVCLFYLANSFWQQYTIRVNDHASNAEQLGVITDVLRFSRPDEPFYDMVGSYIFRPDGYILCCHPYAEFVDHLAERVPTLRDSLIATHTKFVVMDRTAVVFWQPKPDDLKFLRSHYLVSGKNWKFYLHGYKFGCIQGDCQQYDIDNNPITDFGRNNFQIIGDDTYKISIVPANQTITIDQTVVGDQSIIQLSAGIHTFSTDITVQSFSIQLNR